MEQTSLATLADEQIAVARESHSGRAAHTVYGGHEHALRQTLIALVAGQELAEHESPGEATLQVLRGHVRLSSGAESWEGRTGDYAVIPPDRHALAALEDSVVLLTVATGRPRAGREDG